MNSRIDFNKGLSLHWHCEARDQHSITDLRSALADRRHPLTEDEFRNMLAQAICERRYSAQEYLALTGLDFETADEVAQDLQQLWRQLYGDAEYPKPYQ